MKKLIITGAAWVCCIIWTGCNAPAKEAPSLRQDSLKNEFLLVGGNFENSEFIYYGIPGNISWRDTSPGWTQKGQKILLTGTVYQLDGKTPAPGVLLYYYHTNIEGRYLHRPGEKRSMPPNELGQTHGYIRGWVKTDTAGRYSIYTVRPGAYPTHDEPEHIHINVKEPNNINEYYIDDFVFDDDKLLLPYLKKYPLQNRGGSGVLRVLLKGDLQVAERNIILGLNIPGYPGRSIGGERSGLNIGEDQPSFGPFHAYGPDRGTQTCPVCKYGRYHGIIYFVGNNPNWDEIKQWLIFLENESIRREKYLKAYFVFGNGLNYNRQQRQKQLEQLGQALNIRKMALTYVPSFSDIKTEVHLNKINPDVDNTFIIYKHRNIVDKYINLKPTPESFKSIDQALDRSRGTYFDLEEPEHE